jgi:hypothetical protein
MMRKGDAREKMRQKSQPFDKKYNKLFDSNIITV